MKHDHHMAGVTPPTKSPSKRLREFLPLILVLGGILLADALTMRVFQRSGWMEAMRLFMGLFFLTFGAFKLLDLKAFVMAYAEYDIVAKRSTVYAYLYPFIELALAMLYLTNTSPVLTNSLTAVLMAISSIGVIQTVWVEKRNIHCACLGAVVKLPMTTVTVIEDLGMGLMAVVMLLTLLS